MIVCLIIFLWRASSIWLMSTTSIWQITWTAWTLLCSGVVENDPRLYVDTLGGDSAEPIVEYQGGDINRDEYDLLDE